MGIASGNVKFTYAQLMSIWEQAGGSPTQSALAAAVAMAESGGNSAAYNNDSNGTVDRGLWQINSSHGNQSSFDVMTNARAAVDISCNGKCTNSCSPRGYTGWGNWSTYCSGAYQQFYQSGASPDNNVPINATNAAANQPSATSDATLESGVSWTCLIFPWQPTCVKAVIGGTASGILQLVFKGVLALLNPLIELIAGVEGMAAGGMLMLFGAYEIVTHTEAGQNIKQGIGRVQGTALVGAGVATGQPELMAAGASTAHRPVAAAGRQRISQQRSQQVTARSQAATARSEQVAQGNLAVAQERTRRQEARNRLPGPTTAARERTTREQIKQQSLNYRAELRAQRARERK